MQKHIDLTQPIYEGMPKGQVMPAPTIRTIKEVGKDPFNMQECTFATHIGTHVDAPMHFFPGGKTIDQFPLERFAGRALVLSVKKDKLQPVSLADIKGAGPEAKKGDIILIHTGWGPSSGRAKTTMTILTSARTWWRG